MPQTDDSNVIQLEDSAATAATDSSLRVSRSSDTSPCLPPSVSPDDASSSVAFDGYMGQKGAPDACDTVPNENDVTSAPPCQATGGHAVRRWKRSEFMCLRKLDRCTTVPEELKQDRPEIKALLQTPEIVLRERASLVPAAPLEGRNPKPADVRFGRDETAPATESNACAWRKKPLIKNAESQASRVGSDSRDWRGRRFASHDALEHEHSSTPVADDWLMPTGSDDFDLSKVKNDVDTFEEMRKQARREWAGASPDADSETEDVLNQLMAESMGEMGNQSDNGSNAVQALQNSQQIDVRSLFMCGQSSTSDPGSDILQQQAAASTSAQSGSFSAFPAGGSTANIPVDMRQVSNGTLSDVPKDPGDPMSHPAPQSGGAVRDPVPQQKANSVDLAGDGSSVWGNSGMGSGRLAQDAPVSEVDWKMMREIWNRPTGSEGVQQQMPGMKPADSCIGSGQRTPSHFGGVPQHQQHASGPNMHEMPGGNGGMEAAGEANAMKVLMQLWNTNSEQSASTAAPAQSNPAPHVRSAQQDLSKQLMAFHQQHQQKQQAQRQAAQNGSAITTEQMLQQMYQQHASAAAQHDRAHEPAANDPYGMARAGHANSQPMANYPYNRQTAKPVQQQNGMSGQYTSQAHQLATVLWFQASMAQAAQTQRHQQAAHAASSVRRPMMQDMHRGGGAPVNAHSAALLQQLQQGHGTSQLSHDQYSAAAAAAVAAAQQQHMSQQTLRNQVYGAEQKQHHHYAPPSNVHMMRPGQGHSSQHNSAQVPNYAESVVRAMLLPTAARQHQAQHLPQYRQSQVHPRYNNPGAAGLHMHPQQNPTQHPVAQSGFAHTPGSGVAPNNFSHLYDAGRMRR